MAISYTLNASSAGEKQGWWGGSSKSGTNSTITADFGSAIDTFREKVDTNNITITSAYLAFNCSNSGMPKKKSFKISTDLGSLGTFQDSNISYGQKTKIWFNEDARKELRKWIAEDKRYLYSTDPDPYCIQTNSGYCSNNYVKVNSASLVIEYIVNKSSASLSSTTMNLGKSYNVTITAGSSSYTHNINIIIGSHTYSVASGVSSGTKSITIPTSIGSEEMSKTKTKSAILRLTTFNGSSNLGDNDYSIIIQAGSDCAPTINNISLTLNATPNSSFSGSSKVILNGRTNTTFKVTATPKYGATITNYTISGGGLNGSNTSGSFSSTLSNTGSQTITIVATDSRGHTASTSKTIIITNYSLPSVNNLVVYRCDSSGNRDDVGGKYAKITFSSIFTSSIKDASNSGTTYSNTMKVKVNGTSVSSGSVFGGSYNVDSTYNLNIVSTDSVGNSSTMTITLPSSSYLLHFRRKQNSVGIGCAGDDLSGSSDNGRLTVGWNTKFNSNVSFNGGLTLKNALPVDQGGTGAISANKARENLGITSEINSLKSTISTNVNNLNTSINEVSNKVNVLEKKPIFKKFAYGLTDTVYSQKYGYNDHTINFTTTFDTPPFVMICPQSGSTEAKFGNLCFTVLNVSTTDMTIRIFNNSDTGRNPRVYWLAFEI